MVKAKDIMTESVVTVTKDTSMFEVAQLLSINNISGIPVVDDQMHVEGVITEKDMLDLYHVMQYTESRTVSSSMSREVVTFDMEDDLDDVCLCLRNHPFRRVPVTSDGKIVGVISRRDLILYILRARRTNDMTYSTTC
jgi:CBS domain-containing protein